MSGPEPEVLACPQKLELATGLFGCHREVLITPRRGGKVVGCERELDAFLFLPGEMTQQNDEVHAFANTRQYALETLHHIPYIHILHILRMSGSSQFFCG